MGACGFSIFRTGEEGLRVENIIYLRLSERFEDLGALTFPFLIHFPVQKNGKKWPVRKERKPRVKKGNRSCRPRTEGNLAS